ncbi:hypothetical protein C8R45DRAFT_922055 [Mycena sanguinolenta]|nr:hypothetical protein C8R45DRAFT_922055 [Mycena sanguinolenta]
MYLRNIGGPGRGSVRKPVGHSIATLRAEKQSWTRRVDGSELESLNGWYRSTDESVYDGSEHDHGIGENLQEQRLRCKLQVVTDPEMHMEKLANRTRGKTTGVTQAEADAPDPDSHCEYECKRQQLEFTCGSRARGALVGDVHNYLAHAWAWIRDRLQWEESEWTIIIRLRVDVVRVAQSCGPGGTGPCEASLKPKPEFDSRVGGVEIGNLKDGFGRIAQEATKDGTSVERRDLKEAHKADGSVGRSRRGRFFRGRILISRLASSKADGKQMLETMPRQPAIEVRSSRFMIPARRRTRGQERKFDRTGRPVRSWCDSESMLAQASGTENGRKEEKKSWVVSSCELAHHISTLECAGRELVEKRSVRYERCRRHAVSAGTSSDNSASAEEKTGSPAVGGVGSRYFHIQGELAASKQANEGSKEEEVQNRSTPERARGRKIGRRVRQKGREGKPIEVGCQLGAFGCGQRAAFESADLNYCIITLITNLDAEFRVGI